MKPAPLVPKRPIKEHKRAVEGLLSRGGAGIEAETWEMNIVKGEVAEIEGLLKVQNIGGDVSRS